MEESHHYQFFSHTQCEYFPCHVTEHPEDFNCLFCYCPLYLLGDQCGGNFVYSPTGTKICTNCDVPHRRENYAAILEKYPLIQQQMNRLVSHQKEVETE